MTPPEVLRLHDRIDELDRKWDGKWTTLSDSVNEANATMLREVALCRGCRRIVMGNGGRSIDKRVAVLETIRSISSKGFTIVVVAAASLATGLVMAAVNHVCK